MDVLSSCSLVATAEVPAEKPKVGVEELKASYQRMARMRACGWELIDICAETGIALGKLRMMEGDPAFQEAVAYWAEVGKGAEKLEAKEAYGKMKSLYLDALELQHKKVIANETTPKDLNEILKTLAPKIGIADEAQKVEHVMGADVMEAIKRQLDQQEVSRVTQVDVISDVRDEHPETNRAMS